ncbi:hypothetical protein LguiB_021707 [Lonicera macranthoides]
MFRLKEQNVVVFNKKYIFLTQIIEIEKELDMIEIYIPHANENEKELESTGSSAVELRADIVYTVANIGGHLSACLGVVELAVAYIEGVLIKILQYMPLIVVNIRGNSKPAYMRESGVRWGTSERL